MPVGIAVFVLLASAGLAACNRASSGNGTALKTPPAGQTSSPQASSTPSVISGTTSKLNICQSPSELDPGDISLAFVASWDGNQDIYFINGDGSGLRQFTATE